MKTILVFIGGYLPGEKYGGPVTSIWNFTENLGDIYDIRIVCSNHDFKDPTPYSNVGDGWNQVGNGHVLYLKDELLCYDSFYKIINEINPSVIYASGIMYFKVNSELFKAARKNSIPVLLAPRGDICENALKIKKWKKAPVLFLCKLFRVFKGIYFHATMQEEVDNLIRLLGINEECIFLMPNLPSGPSHRNEYYKKAGRIRIVFVSRIQEKKNLLEAIRIVNRLTVNVEFDIYGPLENQEYWKRCLEEISCSPRNVVVSYKGALSPTKARSIYNSYDCFLFPTYSENYGHVIAESLLHDCPIVISKGTTPWDDVNDYCAGAAIDLDDIDGFVDYLEKIASMNNDEYNCLISNINKYVEFKINNESLKKEYIQMLESVCN